MLPELDKNEAYIWAIVALGLIVPLVLISVSQLRLARARARLRRLEVDSEMSE